MHTFEWIIGLLLGAVALSALAQRIKVPYPTLLAIGGAMLPFIPSGPSWALPAPWGVHSLNFPFSITRHTRIQATMAMSSASSGSSPAAMSHR